MSRESGCAFHLFELKESSWCCRRPVPSHLFSSPQWQAQGRDATNAERWRAALLHGYTPPSTCTHINVPVLMQQTAAALSQWGELQDSLDLESDSAVANLEAQAQARFALKRDLGNLTHLADAQSQHVQGVKLRQMHAMQTMQTASGASGAVGGCPMGSPRGASPLMSGSSTPGGTGVAAGGVSPTDTLIFQQQQQQHAQGYSSVGALSTSPRSTHSTALADAVFSSSAGGGRTPRGTPQSNPRLVPGEDTPTGAGRPTLDWSAAVAGTAGVGSAARTPSLSATPSPTLLPSASPASQAQIHLSQKPSPPPPPPPSQQQQQQGSPSVQHRLREVKGLLDRTEQRNRWAVLIQASLQLMPHEGSTYRHFVVAILNFLSTFNGAAGAEVAQTLRGCLDPRVFDPKDITRSQQRMLLVFNQWAHRGQR